MTTVKVSLIVAVLLAGGCQSIRDLASDIDLGDLPISLPETPQEPPDQPDDTTPEPEPDQPATYRTGNGIYDPEGWWLLPREHPTKRRGLDWSDISNIGVLYGHQFSGPLTNWTTSAELGWRIKVYVRPTRACQLIYEVDGGLTVRLKDILDPSVRHD